MHKCVTWPWWINLWQEISTFCRLLVMIRITYIFQGLCMWSFDPCLMNHGYISMHTVRWHACKEMSGRVHYICLKSQVTHCVSELSQYWFRWWLLAWSAPSHYLNQWWNIVNQTLGKKLQWNLKQNSFVFIQENALENVVWKMVAILSLPECINWYS